MTTKHTSKTAGNSVLRMTGNCRLNESAKLLQWNVSVNERDLPSPAFNRPGLYVVYVCCKSQRTIVSRTVRCASSWVQSHILFCITFSDLIKNIVSFLLDFLERNVHFMIANIPIYSTSKPYIILIGNAKQGVTEPTPRYEINSCMHGASNRSKHQEPVSLKSRNFSSPFRMPKFS